MASSYAPAVLIVDDDTGITEYLREKFHELTSVGVLVANDLGEAEQLLDDKEIRIDAIIADLNFEKAKKAPESGLYDGIDLLRHSKRQRNELMRYVLSFWADRREEHDRAQEEQLDIKRWLPKLYFDDPSDPKTPWAILERDLVKGRIEPDVPVSSEPADPIGPLDDLSDQIRKLFPTPIRTFIQSLGDDSVRCKKPIEVICLREEGYYRSHAVKIGLFQEGIGESVDESIQDLAGKILDQFNRFEAQQDHLIRDYARVVRDQLRAYVEKM